MARFRYRFATILKHKKGKEEESLRALGAAQRAYQEALGRKSQLQRDLQAALLRKENLGSVPTGPLAFELEYNFIVGTKQRIIQQDQAIVRANRGVEKALRSYLHARKQTQMFESLYDKEHAEWRREQAKKEQKQMDDLTVMRQSLREREEEEEAVS